MTRSQIGALFVLLTFGGAAVLPAGPLGTQLPTMTVRLRDYAEVPGPIQKEAVRVARKIFLAAGIETVWLDCGRGGPDGMRDDGCQQESVSTDIQLRILSQRQARRAGLSQNALGYAVLPPEGRGSIANAFSHRVEELARWTGADRTLVLGYIMAHEVAHLLLNRSGHSKRGLMRAVWDKEDLKRPLSVGLAFSSAEATKMQANLLGRHKEQGPTPSTK